MYKIQVKRSDNGLGILHEIEFQVKCLEHFKDI